MGVKTATVEQAGDDGRGKGDETNGGGTADEETPAQGPVKGEGELGVVGGGAQGTEARQDDGAEGDADEADGQFDEAVGVVQPGNAAGDEPGGKVGVDQHGELTDGRTEEGWQHQFEDAAYTAVSPAPARAQQHAAFPQEGQLQGKLGDAADKHRPSEFHAVEALRGGAVVMPPQAGGDEGDVQEDGG